ncbi:MAG: hypothetical protein ACRDNS_29815 [Trebonia sp.]
MFWGAGFAWFLPGLPAFAPVYWWDDVPYYYYDNGYYIWDANQDGYVATAPPPVSDGSSGTASLDSQQPLQDSEPLYAYPENGQSPQQQAADRQACEHWARSQTVAGAGDPAATSGAADAGNGASSVSSSINYRRALAACLMGRGYSVD